MRTTITLDPDVAALLERAMEGRGLSFKQAVNDAIRAGLAAPRKAPPAETPTWPMGFDRAIDSDRALRLAGDLEDDELIRRLAVRK